LTDPSSTYPNPKSKRPSKHEPVLSIPAAAPIIDGRNKFPI